MFLSQIYLSDDRNMHSIISKRSQKLQKLYQECDYKVYTNSALEELIKINFTSKENNIKINNEILPLEIKNLIFEKEKLIFELFYPEILKDNY
jgi:hypothetical protein